MTSALRRLSFESWTRCSGPVSSRGSGGWGTWASLGLAGHQPAALSAFYEFTEALKAALPPEHTEVVALAAATELGNGYQRCQHEQLSVPQLPVEGRPPTWAESGTSRVSTNLKEYAHA